ncbi:8488_t:CDS:2 [Scutellospora calospora]|uniref:8488_t:CDS:1 n=1 Tax=Scutellospora calospora TaxID=85575 RepID=A0ACA9KDB6_9GLOM|nr:8488_t:CDS:2 [Scutellospora calospora]
MSICGWKWIYDIQNLANWRVKFHFRLFRLAFLICYDIRILAEYQTCVLQPSHRLLWNPPIHSLFRFFLIRKWLCTGD